MALVRSHLIIPQPTMTRKPHLLVGHWTHACPAFDLVNKKPVMIMDSWRVSLPEFLLEGETYKLYNVSNIANRIAYHDFGHAELAGSHLSFTPRTLHRLVLDIVGKKLTHLKSTRQLTVSVRDALIAHKGAF